MSDLVTIKSALERASRTVALKPQRGQRSYRNKARITDGLASHVVEGDRALMLDVGKALGGNDQGPTPSMILRSAISSCVAISVKQWAAKLDVSVGVIEVILEANIDARGELAVREDIPPSYLSLGLEIRVESDEPADRVEDMVATALRFSPLIDVLARSQPLQHSVTTLSQGKAI